MPTLPKLRKQLSYLKVTKMTYTSIVNSLVRPNISLRASNAQHNNSNPQQQMAPPVKAAPVNKSQTQASRDSRPQIINSNQNSNAALITRLFKE
ncbi:hypothetical protein TNCV_5033691 [Trichonephila clavipes]|nr:hypothetical protein TNCV_5033691 [Trichonephila clavipes]